MKKFITVLLSLSMVLSSLGTLAFAEGETASYKDGDLVWSEDFESYAVGYDYEANPTNGIYYANGGSGTATVKEDSTGNKYLYHGRKNDSNNYIFIAPAGDAISDNDEFTFDIDMKFDTIGGGAHNFGLGNTNAAYLYGAYASFNPTETNKSGNSGFEVQTERSVTSKFVQTVPGEDVQGNKVRVHANAWNTYRFIARKTEDGKYYADLYINGAYFYMIGTRTGSKWGGENGNNNNCFLFALPKSTTTACSVDNIKCYYGAVESNEYVTKGEVTVDRYTFDECTAGEYKYVDKEGGSETVAGGNADHAFGVIKRYSTWGMNLDINSGKAGKASGDNSLSVHSGGRLAFTNVNNDQDGNTAAYSTRYGTWVPEGDSLEFSADVLFKDLKENWLFQLEAAVDNQDIAIEITPNFYSLGDWENPDDFQNNRERIAPKIPLNTWVNIRVIITRGTSDTYNKLTIYADDNVICENKDITTWYTATNTTVDEKTIVTYGEARKGDLLSKGLGKIYFQGECDYDNITIKKYLLGQPVPAPAAAPTLVNTSTKVNDYPSLRGKVYTDGRTIQNVVDAFGITGDFVVRDANGNTVTDYTQTADGNYIEIKANGKKYYGAFAANNVVETITETTGTLGGFVTTEDTALTVETVTKGYGRDGDSILIKNTKTVDPEAEKIEYDDTERFIKTLNTDENAYMELSFLADEDTAFYLGYTVYYVMKDSTAGYETKLGANRGYNENIQIKDGIVKHNNGDTNYRVIGSYKTGEWTKLRLEWNSMNDNKIAVSINDATPVLLNAGPNSYFKTIRTVSITPEKNSSAVIDDIVVMEGYKKAPIAAYITDITDITATTGDYVYNTDDAILVAADYSNELVRVQHSIGDALVITPSDAKKVWLKADGTKATENTDNVARLVLVNDGVYTYYTIENRAGITEFKNEDGTSTVVVDVTNLDVVDLSKAKLISAVYNTDGTLSSVVLNDLVFDEDTYTCEIDITPQTFDAKTQTITYFAWDMNELQPLCDSLE